MAYNIGDMSVLISGSSRGLSRTLYKTKGDIVQFEKDVNKIGKSRGSVGTSGSGAKGGGLFGGNILGSMGNVIKSPWTWAAGAGAGVLGGFGLTSLVTDSLKIAGSMEDTAMSFRVMIGDAVKAEKLFGEIVDMARKTPLTTRELSDVGQLLLGVGTEAEQVVPTLRMLGDLAQGDAEKMRYIGIAYGQIKGMGRLMGQEYRQLVNQMVNVGPELANVLGVEVSQISGLMEEGKISFRDLQQAMINMTSEGGRFYGMMEQRSKTFNGLISTVKDNWELMLGAFGEAVIDEFGLKPFLVRLADLFDRGKDGMGEIRPLLREAKELAVDFGDALFGGLAKSLVLAVELVNWVKRTTGDIEKWEKRFKQFGAIDETVAIADWAFGDDAKDKRADDVFDAKKLEETLKRIKSVLGGVTELRDTGLDPGNVIGVFARASIGMGGQHPAFQMAGRVMQETLVRGLGFELAEEIKKAISKVELDPAKLTADQLKRISSLTDQVNPLGAMKKEFAEIFAINRAGGFVGKGQEYAFALASTFNKFAKDFEDSQKLASVAIRDSAEAVSAITHHRMGMPDQTARVAAILEAMRERQEEEIRVARQIVEALGRNKAFIIEQKMP